MTQPTRYPSLQYQSVEPSLPAAAAALSGARQTAHRTLVVLDDDPTGTQTVHDITVLTTFAQEAFEQQLRRKERGFFILTNSRALPSDQASSLLRNILINLRDASRAVDVNVDVVLRSDSTLRGHFPLEAQLAHSIMGPFPTWILAPAFFEGGRVTIDDVHYAREGDSLTPVAETPFAQDRSFGFTSSNLREWACEKYRQAGDGDDAIPEMTSIGISQLRDSDGPSTVAALLDKASSSGRNNQPHLFILNGFSRHDYDVFVAGESLARTTSPRLYRTGASFISARLGISSIPPISAAQLFRDEQAKTGGLIVAGSYVPKTTAQLEALLARCSGHLVHVEVDVGGLLVAPEGKILQIVQDTASHVEHALGRGKDCLISTSRKLIYESEASANLSIGKMVSSVLVKIVKAINLRPRYVIAKGGITSSDMATKAMEIKIARVIGQAAPGVPLWRSQTQESKWAGIPYVVFPGNVGDQELLGELVESYKLS